MAVSKVILNNETLMDVTQDSVTASTLLEGETATGADGVRITGAASGGSTVSVTQILASGTEIASITVDGTATSLYAPTVEVATAMEVTTMLTNNGWAIYQGGGGND